MRSARLTNACNFFFLRGAGIPEILQIFRAIFAPDWRHLDAGLASYLASERTPTRTRTETKLCASRDHAGRVHATSARAAAEK